MYSVLVEKKFSFDSLSFNYCSILNQIQFKTITKFEWDHQYYLGNLVSVTNKFTAYCVKGKLFVVVSTSPFHITIYSHQVATAIPFVWSIDKMLPIVFCSKASQVRSPMSLSHISIPTCLPLSIVSLIWLCGRWAKVTEKYGWWSLDAIKALLNFKLDKLLFDVRLPFVHFHQACKISRPSLFLSLASLIYKFLL